MGYYDGTNRAEYSRAYKPESNNGCCGGSSGCNEPSRAPEGTPRWEWEQIYGKLVTYFALRSDENGHTYKLIERIPCPLNTSGTSQASCCSIKYKVSR